MLELIKIHIKVTLRLVNHYLLHQLPKPTLRFRSAAALVLQDRPELLEADCTTTYDKGIVTWINTQCSARNARMMSIRRFGIVCFTTFPKANDVNLACFR